MAVDAVIIDVEAGVISWGSAEQEAEVVVALSPESLARLAAFDTRILREDLLKRQGFKDFGYDKDELARAKRSRNLLPVVHSDTHRETDESKARNRALTRELRARYHVRKKREGKMEPIVDVASGKVTFPKVEPKAEKEAKDTTYVYISKSSAAKLAGLAKQDGFSPDAQTERGVAQQTNKAVGVYVQMAIDSLIAKRATPARS